MMPMAKCARFVSARPLRTDDLRVLQIALRPASVADRDVDERRRALFPRAVEIRRHAHFPAGAAHERGFDEVVRQHVTAERPAPGQLRQAAGLRERGDADDRVVTPVVAFVAATTRPRRARSTLPYTRPANCWMRENRLQ